MAFGPNFELDYEMRQACKEYTKQLNEATKLAKNLDTFNDESHQMRTDFYHCALPALRGNTDCCKYCTNNPNKSQDTPISSITTDRINGSQTSSDETVKMHTMYSSKTPAMMYVLPEKIPALVDLIGDTYNIIVYNKKQYNGIIYLVVGLVNKEPGDQDRDAKVEINFYE